MQKRISIRLLVLAGGLGTLLLSGCSTFSTNATKGPQISESGGIAAKDWNTKTNTSTTLPTGLARGTAAETDAPPVLADVTAIFEQFLTNTGLSMTPAKPNEVARFTAAWNNKIIFTPDPTHGGEMMPGILGRLYMFGPDEKFPLAPEGELVVGAWDHMNKDEKGKPKLLELWYIDRDTMRKLAKRDFMGNGYTVFLPFSKYNVDLVRINVMARFNSADGRSMMAAPEVLSLDHSAALQQAQDKLGITPKELYVDKDKPTLLPPPMPFLPQGMK
jgi:hypothetical protein